MNHGYNKTNTDHIVFVKKFSDGDFVILFLYVDDMLIVGRDTNKIEKLKRDFTKSFLMKDLGPNKQILGMKITRDRASKKLWLSQENILRKFLRDLTWPSVRQTTLHSHATVNTTLKSALQVIKNKTK